MRILAAAFGILAAQALAAEQDFVTDLALCPLDPIERHEKGLSFDGQFITEIEWLCEMETPLPQVSWTKDQTFFRMGYCNEPGAVFPGVFVFMVSEYNPGQLSMYNGDSGEPTEFHLCQ